MANVDTSSMEASSRLLLREAEELYAGALSDFMAMRRAMRQRGEISEAEVKRVTGSFTRAMQTLFDERKKVEDLSKRQRGTRPDDAIDFDAVRGEIGGLLDRLRAHRGPV